ESRIFIGPNFSLQSLYDVKPKPDGLLDTTNFVGARGGISSGMGFEAAMDHRNSTLNPRKGYYVQFIAQRYAPMFGSDFRFADIDMQFRKFFSVRKKKDVIALMAHAEFMPGSVPFRMLTMIGSAKEMRGTYAGR